MSIKQFSLQEKFDKLNGILFGFAKKTGLNEDDAEDVVQQTWFKCIERMQKDKNLLQQLSNDSAHFNGYIFRALRNNIINFTKDKKKRNGEFIEKNEEINSIKGKKSNPGLDTANLNSPDDPRDPIMDLQRKEVVQKFFSELKEELREDELQFLDLYLDIAEEDAKINISKVARLMGLSGEKGHNIFRRIIRKAEAFESKNRMLEDVSAAAAVFEFPIFAFFKDLFRKEEVIDDELLKAGKRISQNVLEKLGVDAISTLSKIIK